MKTGKTNHTKRLVLLSLILIPAFLSCSQADQPSTEKLDPSPRVIVTSDGEIDDECSMVRFLLYTNEWDVEGIITSSSQYHWHGHRWAGDDWIEPYLDAYTTIYPNLVKHDSNYPSPDYLRSVTFLGNVETEGEMDSITPGSRHIAEVLLDRSDNQPVWIQAWGGTNTIARALRTIEEDYPDQMEYVAGKIRFFFIWEQDSTYQAYIRPHWGKYDIPTIISDQFEAIAYRWKNCQPEEMQPFFRGAWMTENILENHGPLCSLYKAHEEGDDGFDEGDFRSEGDSPAFLHCIPTGLRNMESPGYGGWGGRYTLVRENTWLDPVPEEGYTYPEGRWYSRSAWGRKSSSEGNTVFNSEDHRAYFKPIWRWSEVMQNDFAARADWCVLPYDETNHPPLVSLNHDVDLSAKAGSTIQLDASGSSDPDGNTLSYYWWIHEEAGSFKDAIEVASPHSGTTRIILPADLDDQATIHVICEVTDDGIPVLSRYKRVIITVQP